MHEAVKYWVNTLQYSVKENILHVSSPQALALCKAWTHSSIISKDNVKPDRVDCVTLK